MGGGKVGAVCVRVLLGMAVLLASGNHSTLVSDSPGQGLGLYTEPYTHSNTSSLGCTDFPWLY